MAQRTNIPTINPRLLGAGLLAGAALGAVYAGVKKRQYAKHGAPHLLDWDRAQRIALQVVREEPYEVGWHERWEAYYRDLVERCYPIITAEMGRPLPAPVEKIEAFTRSEWIEANISNFRDLFEHIETVYKRVQDNNLGTMLLAEASQALLSSQLGVLLGYLARRVLGQYDLALLGKETVDAGKLYFVEPNIAAVQAELGLDPDDFRLWIALHETTHAYEFEAYPWVREHFNSLLEGYIASVGDEIVQAGMGGIGGLRSMVERARASMRDGDSWIEAIMSPAQRALFSKLQATMSIVEGYSNYIMNSVGARLLPSYEYIKVKIEERAARRSQAEKLFIRITGLALKMEQYKLGESFINAIVRERGIEVANRIWEGPDMIPTLEELRNPHAWLERIDA